MQIGVKRVTPEYPGSVPKCFGILVQAPVKLLPLARQRFWQRAWNPWAGRQGQLGQAPKLNHVVCVLPFGYSRSLGGHTGGW